MPPADHTARRLKVFGSNLRRERMARQLTQEKLAEMADLNVRTVRKIEAGQTNILITTLDRLRRSLGCSSDALMGK